MKIKLLPQRIRENTASEEQLFDVSIMESIYAIRALQAAIYYSVDTVVEVGEPNADGQVFLDEFDIHINKDEYSIQK